MILALLLALAAAPDGTPPDVTAKDGVLLTRSGAPLYVYANDTMAGMSHCFGDCAADHPPLLAAAGAKPSGDWTLIDRGDGSRQWALRDKPLYTAKATAEEMAERARQGGYWSPAVLSPAAAPMRVTSQLEGSEFSCGGDRKLVAQFTGQATPGAIVDAGDGPHPLKLMPWRGGEPNVTWSDGRHTLVWSTGVKLMWTDGAAHLACGRAMHHH